MPLEYVLFFEIRTEEGLRRLRGLRVSNHSYCEYIEPNITREDSFSIKGYGRLNVYCTCEHVSETPIKTTQVGFLDIRKAREIFPKEITAHLTSLAKN